MTRSELIQRISQTQSHLVERDVALAVNMMLEQLAACLAGGGRIEIRGFGSFSVRFRRARVGRNPSDRNAGITSGEICALLQAGQASARTSESRA